MKISYEWLREYVNTKMRAENLALKLTMAGHEVSSTEKHGKDIIFDMEITANRPDCLSHIGIARETAAITGKRLMLPMVRIAKKNSSGQSFKVRINNLSACPRYTCRVIKGVKVGPSPKWLVKRIESIGLRPVNNIVDITNFVLHETGQPLHAFDIAKLPDKEIVVREAVPGEAITMIDGYAKQLSARMLVIASDNKPVAVAGVMGAKESEVTEGTKDILLESAYFDPVSVRRTAYKLALSTDSSYRFERGVDPDGVLFASDRAACLIRDIAKGEIAGITDTGKALKQTPKIPLKPGYVNKLLGTDLKASEMRKILTGLGYKIKGSSGLVVTAPSFRQDTTRPADLAEEIARAHGYDEITARPLRTIVTDEDEAFKDFAAKRRIAKDLLVSSGYYEIITYSLVNSAALKDTVFEEDGAAVIKNPLSADQDIMRFSLLPGMLRTVSHNLSRQVYDVKLFELSKIYYKQESDYTEEPSLVFARYAKPGKSAPDTVSRENPLFRVKGVLSVLCEKLGVKEITFEKATHPLFEKESSMALLAGNLMLGTAGSVNSKALDAFGIKGRLFAAEINFSRLAGVSSLVKYYKPLARFPYSYRDISFSVASSVQYKELLSFIKKTGGTYLENAELLSEYRGGQIDKSRRGIAVRLTFRSKDKTLTEEEIDSADSDVREGLKKNFNASLR